MLDQWTWPDSLKPDRIFNWQLSTKRSGVIDSKWYRGEMGSQCDYHDFSFSKITALGNEYLLSRWLLCWNILWLSLSLKNCSQQNGLGPNPVLKMQLEYDGQHRELLSLGKNNSQAGFIFSGVWLVSTFALLEFYQSQPKQYQHDVRISNNVCIFRVQNYYNSLCGSYHR